MGLDLSQFWSEPTAEVMTALDTRQEGLTDREARLRRGADRQRLKPVNQRASDLTLLLNQFKSPIVLLLLIAAGLSFSLQDAAGTGIILVIVLISGALGFWQECGAAHAVQQLLAMVQVDLIVRRDGREVDLPIGEVVPGDVVLLTPGEIIPGDCLLLEANKLFMDEATLTGETFPVEKTPGILPAATGLAERTNSVFMGRHVVSGTGTAVVVQTSQDTEFGKISETLRLRPPETGFERGVRHFGYLLMEVTLLLVIGIFAVNVDLHRPVMESFLFSLAIAVGLTPQLLPAIISVNLAHGARRMAREKVIVKRLAAIEDFGSMDILCSDKTGTLTRGKAQLDSARNVSGDASDRVLLYAHLNAAFQTGYANPIDEAILSFRHLAIGEYEKLDEEAYDFVRKRLSVLVRKGNHRLLITNGALSNVLEVCTTAETADGQRVDLGPLAPQIQRRFEEFSGQGFRTLGVAYRDAGARLHLERSDEAGMTFLGFLLVFDPLQPEITATLQRLRRLGVSVKIITGDNRLVAADICRKAGLPDPRVLTGPELLQMSQAALITRSRIVNVFAEVEPNQKERIILALKKAGHIVGYMGDGINDAPALHAADVGISVADAVDVAREAAAIVLLDKDLGVLERGVWEGRVTFANTLKYVFMATSANFGNMFSMAGASLFLPFLPLLPQQILLGNLMTDFPEMTISTDSVDPEMVEQPRRWDIEFIRRFMLVFGLANSACDYLTFGVLLFLMHATPIQFRTGWFIENVVTAALIVLVIRTRQPFYASRPSTPLLIATVATVGAALALPYTPLARVLGFQPLGFGFLLGLSGIMVFYGIVAEVAKSFFYARERPHRRRKKRRERRRAHKD